MVNGRSYFDPDKDLEILGRMEVSTRKTLCRILIKDNVDAGRIRNYALMIKERLGARAKNYRLKLGEISDRGSESYRWCVLTAERVE